MKSILWVNIIIKRGEKYTRVEQNISECVTPAKTFGIYLYQKNIYLCIGLSEAIKCVLFFIVGDGLKSLKAIALRNSIFSSLFFFEVCIFLLLISGLPKKRERQGFEILPPIPPQTPSLRFAEPGMDFRVRQKSNPRLQTGISAAVGTLTLSKYLFLSCEMEITNACPTKQLRGVRKYVRILCCSVNSLQFLRGEKQT